MNEIEISKQKLDEALYKALLTATSDLPKDVEGALESALLLEDDPLAKLQLQTTLKNLSSARDEQRLACGDTGFPLFYVVIGDNVRIEGGLSSLYDFCRKSVARATENFRLRSTMVHPLTRKNTGNNCGYYIPMVDVHFDNRLDGIKIVSVLKGGGAEIYGSYFKMLVAADGVEGVTKFILESTLSGTKEGKTCPPSIIGVGIGGTSDLCMRMAKEAAVLRPIGSRHPETEIAQYETEILKTINSMGIGPMGTSGKTTALDVHIEYGMVHTGALPVAVNIQCAVARRCIVEINGSQNISFQGAIDWDYR